MRIKFHNSKHQSVDGISAVNWDLSLGFKMMRPFQTALMMLKWVTNLFYVGPCMLRVFEWTIISLHPTVEDLKYIHNQLISCSHQQSIMQHLLCNYPQLVTAPAAYYLSKVVDSGWNSIFNATLYSFQLHDKTHSLHTGKYYVCDYLNDINSPVI